MLTLASGRNSGRKEATIVPITLTRDIAADPNSVALLLAAPSSITLWPGVAEPLDRAAGDGEWRAAAGPVAVIADVPGRGPVRVAVATDSPSRTPTSFVLGFTFQEEDLPLSVGTLKLGYRTGVEGAAMTTADLSLQYSGCREEALRDLAVGFLANLARVAEERAHAA